MVLDESKTPVDFLFSYNKYGKVSKTACKRLEAGVIFIFFNSLSDGHLFTSRYDALASRFRCQQHQ